MSNPYSMEYGSTFLDEEMLDQFSAAEGREERVNLLREILSHAESPYTYWRLIFDESGLTGYLADAKYLVLDYIVENAAQWEPDEVACFLLAVATDHPTLQTGATYLIELDLPDIRNLPYAWDFIWGSFSAVADHRICPPV